ncbi:MAG: aminotransferase [Deltaproteobacteria bacterium]|nr:MAG: aminotransferase [Deltaproteobacteria bacterium]
MEAVPFPPISEVKGWVAGREFPPERPLIDLCQAVPDFPPAPALIEHLKPLLDDPQTSRYSPDEGLPEARAAVAGWLARRYGAGPDPDEVCLTIGASQAFWLALLTLCRAGDEVIVQLPAYFDHPMALGALGITPVYAPFTAGGGGCPDPAVIAGLITPKTRALLLVTPSNPTGAVIPPAVIDELFALARRHDLVLILDETYNAFLPAGRSPHRLFALAGWQEHFVQIASFGKTFALTGYRAGALVAGRDVIRQALKIQDTMVVCQPRLTQHAVRFGCERLDDWVAANALMMQRRHDRFTELFSAAGNPFRLVASGTFFAWVRHPWPTLSGREAARRLAAEADLLCLPGEAFGPGMEPYLRLAFGNLPDDRIAVAVDHFRTCPV